MGKKLGLKIKQLRSEYTFNTGEKLTQKDLADKLNISRSYLGDIESGRSSASDELIYKLSEIFGVADSELFKCKFDDDINNNSTELNELDNNAFAISEKKERDYSISTKEQENIGDEAKKIIEELSMSFSKNKDLLGEDDYFAVENAIRTTLEAIKIKNKKKFTPKKYK
jgi:transcriptional regulator with XRE-family HTH domain